MTCPGSQRPFCSQILRNRGCVSPKDFQQLLEEVTLPTLRHPLHTQPGPSVLDLCQQFEGSPSFRPATPRSPRGSLNPPLPLLVPTHRSTWVLAPEKEKEEKCLIVCFMPFWDEKLGLKEGSHLSLAQGFTAAETEVPQGCQAPGYPHPEPA